jgi:hypothetical protein
MLLLPVDLLLHLGDILHYKQQQQQRVVVACSPKNVNTKAMQKVFCIKISK